MNSQTIFDAINESQDGRPLRRWLLENPDSDTRMSDAINALLVAAYRESDTADDLLSALSYAASQVRAAVTAVRDSTHDEWCHSLLSSIKDGGVWGIPRSGLVFRVDHSSKSLTLVSGSRDDEDFAATATAFGRVGWSVS